MNEYTFLGSNSFRSEHVKARTLREAYRKTVKWYHNIPEEHRARFGILRGRAYQWAKSGAMTMSGWLDSRDKTLKDVPVGIDPFPSY